VSTIAGTTPFPIWQIALGGAALGVAYTLSPLTVLLLPALALLVQWVGRPLGAREREWLYGLVATAVALRLIAVAGLFLMADADRPFATFFGDEEMFKSRSIWLRNIGLGVPISAADFIYAVEETGKSSYLFVLAYLSAIVGDAPYGTHVLNTTLYLVGGCLIYRLVRPSYGRLVALGGLALLLFLPSLFFWSISALKEPLYTFLAAAELWCALTIARGRPADALRASARSRRSLGGGGWYWRVAAIAGVIGLGVLLEGLRKGGLLVAGLGTIGGVILGSTLRRPRLAAAALLLLPVAALVMLRVPAIQDRAMSVVRESAIYHVGHVFTPGYSYKTLDSWYYIDPADIRRMQEGDAVKYVISSLVHYVVEPLPWTIESRSMLAFLPEHMIWLTLAALIPIGLMAGFRLDPILTAVLAAHGSVVVLIVAMTSGNVGTLIRHRGLVLPYVVWLSMLGGYHLLLRAAPALAARTRLVTEGQGTAHGTR
jgi:hypothetical protein